MTDPVELAGHLAQSATLLGNHLVGPVKAMLYCVDDATLSVKLQFNPESLRLDRGVSLSPGSGVIFAGFEPSNARNDTLIFETWLDTSELPAAANAAASLMPYTFSTVGSSQSILEQMEALYLLTLPGAPMMSSYDAEVRPPVVVFLWDKLKFTGMISAMNFDIKLFDPLGAPRRASVYIQMEGRAFWTTSTPDDVLNDTASAQTFLVGTTPTTDLVETARSIALRVLNRLI